MILNMKAKITISTLITAFIFASLIGCAVGPVEIEEITVCKNVDSDYAPIDPTEVFPSDIRVIYVSTKVNNFTPKDKLSIIWIYIETNKELTKQEIKTEETCSGYKTFEFKSDQGFPSGKYNAIIYLNDELVETVEFSVE